MEGSLRLSHSLLMISMIFGLFACSNKMKIRQEQREKLAANSGLYCDFVNGDEYKDVEVELNMVMAKRCDPNKSMTITNYKNASEIYGLVYCCAMNRKEKAAELLSSAKSSKAVTEKVSTPPGKPGEAAKEKTPPPAPAGESGDLD